jgi:hypothetical protein
VFVGFGVFVGLGLFVGFGVLVAFATASVASGAAGAVLLEELSLLPDADPMIPMMSRAATTPMIQRVRTERAMYHRQVDAMSERMRAMWVPP